MNEHQREERRRAVRNNIDAALDHIERDAATGIEMQLRDGAHASGDWARISDDRVTVFGSVMGITSAQTLLLDDVLVVQTVWSDVTPAFVAPDSFDVVFDRLLVEAVAERFGSAAILEALDGEGPLGDRFTRIDALDPWESDEVRGMVAARLPKALSPAGDLRLLEMPVITFVESERDTMRGLLNPALVAYVADEPLTSDAPASRKTMLDLSRDHPEIANAMLIAAMKLEIRRGSERYAPLDRLRFEIGGILAQWFRRRGS